MPVQHMKELLSLFTHKGNLKWNYYFHLTDLQRSKRLIASFPFNNYFLFYMPVTVPSAEDMPLRRKLKEINKKQKTSALTEFIFWRVAKEILMVAIRLVRTYTETNLTSIEITNTRTLQSSNFAFNKISLHIYFYRCKMLFMKLITASLSSVNRRLVIYS